jgi:hypothetical protein
LLISFVAMRSVTGEAATGCAMDIYDVARVKEFPVVYGSTTVLEITFGKQHVI